MSQGQIFQKINEEFGIIILMRSSYVTTSWGGDRTGREKELKERAGFTGLYRCDGHTTVTCYWRDFVALALHHGKNGKKIGHGTSLTQNLRHPVTLRHTIYKGRHIRQPKAYCIHTIYTHRHTLIRADTRVVREITVE